MNFDLAFRAKNPVLSKENVMVSLHVDLEPQKTYHPGYPVEKRGVYYLARRLSSQLSLVTRRTDYGQLEKCYSIWICRDDIPEEAQYSISVYEMTNTKNTHNHEIPREDFDLMTLVVIKLGNKVYNGEKGDEGYGLLRFLNMIMYPHRADFMETVSEYIDFSENEELWKEAVSMSGLGQSILEEGREEGMQQGIEQGIEQGMQQGIEQGKKQGIQALILDHLEEQVPREKSIAKLQRFFGLTKEEAEGYYDQFARQA